MLRGVNKNIIEIVETENQYFEKAILFVRPAVKEPGADLLRQKAVEYLSAVQPQAQPHPPEGGAVQTKVRLSPWVGVGVGVAILLAAALLVFL